MGVASGVCLTGRLICSNADEAARVARALPAHVELTRAEPGCLSFQVTQSDDPLIWEESEQFVDAQAFEAHQTRAGASDWARVTRGITRDYQVTGLR